VVRSQKPSECVRTGWTDQIHRVLLAGVGAVVLAQEEVEDLVGRLVKRGELAEKDGRDLVREVLDRQHLPAIRPRIDALEALASGVVKGVLRRMNLVTRTDVAELEQKIDELSRQVLRLEGRSRK